MQSLLVQYKVVNMEFFFKTEFELDTSMVESSPGLKLTIQSNSLTVPLHQNSV